MATSKTVKVTSAAKAATANAKPARKLPNLATAKVADGSLPSIRSLYDICGIASNNYRTSDVNEYLITIRAMDLIELHDEAYRSGVLAADNREILLERLERKFRQEIGRFKERVDLSAS